MSDDRIIDPFRRPLTVAEQIHSWRDQLPVTRAGVLGLLAAALDGMWEYVIAQTTVTTGALTDMEARVSALEGAGGGASVRRP